MIRTAALLTAVILTAAFAPGRASAQLADMVPQGIDCVGLNQLLDAPIALDVPFTDENGYAVEISQYFDGRRPVLITFNYTDCPLMCSQQLDGFVDALKELEGVVPGDDFQILTISIDHRETWKKAGLTKEKYLRDLGSERSPAADAGWHFLVGAEKNIRAVADSVGFYYKWVNPTAKYSHVPAIIVATPEGHTSRYFSGWDYGPVDLRRALVAASEGEIGTFTDAFFFSCFAYDPDKGAYGMKFMRVGGALAVLTLILLIVAMRRMEPKIGDGDPDKTIPDGPTSGGECAADDSAGMTNTDQKNHDTPNEAEVAR